MQSRISQYKAHEDWHDKYRRNCLERLKQNRSKVVNERRRSNLQSADDDVDGVKSEVDHVLSEEWNKLFGHCTGTHSNLRDSGKANTHQPNAVSRECDDDFDQKFQFLECIRNELLNEARRYQSVQNGAEVGAASIDLDCEDSRMSCDNDFRISSTSLMSAKSSTEQFRPTRTVEQKSSLVCPICASHLLSFERQFSQVACYTCSYAVRVPTQLCDPDSLRQVFDEAIASHARSGPSRSAAYSCALSHSQPEQVEEDIEELLQACVARPSFSIVSDGSSHNVLLSCDACDFMFLVV